MARAEVLGRFLARLQVNGVKQISIGAVRRHAV
jgi:hypothetical protein